MKTYIGLDVGTSSVKLMLIDQNGRVIKTVKKHYPISYPKPGWSEQSPEDWFDKTIDGLEDLLLDQDKTSVKGVGFAGQMHGLVILDQEDQIIRPAILWNDGRTQKETDALNEHKELILNEVSNIAFSGFTATKLLWLRENEPQHYSMIHKIMLPKDYVIYRMTGVHSTDKSDASGTLLFDIKNGTWNKKLCELCHIKMDTLPKVFDSQEIIGTLSKTISNRLGLNHDVFCVAGASDNAAAAIGNGIIDEGDCNLSLGTSGTLFVPINQTIDHVNEAIHQFSYTENKTHLMGVILSAASCNQWWIESILKTKDYQQELSDLDHMIGKNHIYFLPYLMGERSPHNDSNAKSLFIGMTPNTKREDMTLAVLEGIAFALRDTLEALKKSGVNIKKTRICGGGAQIDALKKIISAVLNMPLEILELDDGASYGAALLGLKADSSESLTDLTKRVVKVRDIVSPDQKLVEAYEQMYHRYQSLYPALKNIFRSL